jgi:hypothetical protein
MSGGFFSDEEWAVACALADAQEEVDAESRECAGLSLDEEFRIWEAEQAKLELAKERIAIQVHDGGLSEEEALESVTTCIRTSTSNEDNDRSNMTHFSRHNCMLIPASPDTACEPPPLLYNAGKSQHLTYAPACANDVVKADGCDIILHGKEASPVDGEKVPTIGNEATTYSEAGVGAQNKDWSFLSQDDKINRARGDLLTENVESILKAHFLVPQNAAKAVALAYLTKCRNLDVRDPIKVLTDDLSILWAMKGSTSYTEPGVWIFRELHNYAKYRKQDDAPPQYQRHAQPPKTNWSKVRQDLINCGRVGGQPMRGADLSDYVAHVRSTGGRFDTEVSHALSMLAHHGLIERRNGGISVRAETLEIKPEKKQQIGIEKALAHLQSVVERCYPNTTDWRATVDSLFPLMKFWRSQRNPDMILGLADQIAERHK